MRSWPCRFVRCDGGSESGGCAVRRLPGGAGKDSKDAAPPPGAGNDLARCLSWGGGMYAYQQTSVQHLLALLEQSTATLLDRWNVTIVPQVPPPPPPAPGGVQARAHPPMPRSPCIGAEPRVCSSRTISSLRLMFYANFYRELRCGVRRSRAGARRRRPMMRLSRRRRGWTAARPDRPLDVWPASAQLPPPRPARRSRRW